MKGAPKVGHAPFRGAKKIFGLFLVSRFSNDFILGVGRFGYFDKLTSMVKFWKKNCVGVFGLYKSRSQITLTNHAHKSRPLSN